MRTARTRQLVRAVHIWLALRAGLPSLMNPEPLIRVASRIFFNHARKSFSIYANLFFEVASPHQGYFGIEAKTMPLKPFVPYQETWNNRSICTKREYCKPCSRAGRDPKEVTEYPLIRQYVYIYQQPYILTAPERFEHRPDRH